MTELVTIDGRGMTIHDAITEMWERIQPLEQRGFNPVSGVEIVDAQTKEIVQNFQLTDPEFQLHLKTDEQAPGAGSRKIDSHKPESKGHFRYLARIQLSS